VFLHLLIVTTFGLKAATAGQLLVSSFLSDRVGRYDAVSGEYLDMLDGRGLDGPLSAKIGPDNLLYVASEGSNQIKRYNWRTGAFIDDFVSRGAGGLNGPTGIAWDAAGDLYVASFNNDAIFKYDGVTGQFLTTVVASGQGGLNGPDNGMLFGPDEKLYVPSYLSNQILRYDLAANTSEVFINGIGQPRVLVFHDDQLFITSEAADAVKRYDLNGTFLDDFIRPGRTVLDTPVGLEFMGDAWFVTSATLDKVVKFDRNGQLIDADFIAARSGGIDGPTFLTAIVPEPHAHLLFLALLAAGNWIRCGHSRPPRERIRAPGPHF
jgi:DNA-binding beta-propeller fold protein YncE